MNYVVKFIGSLVLTFAILGLPVIACLSFVFEWYIFFRLVLVVAVVIEATFVSGKIYERSEDAEIH